MPEIGETLRETRMRRRIDITEVETATKIRAKYLRALENEEWNLLPGPTFVKTFLRTYAEYLEIDGRMLVEEYKQRFEGPSTQELAPFTPTPGRRRRRSPRQGRIGPSPALLVGGVLIALLALLFAIGKLWPTDDDDEPGANRVSGETPRAERDQRERAGGGEENEREREPRRPRIVRLRIIPTGTVSVCLVDARGRARIDNATLTADGPTPVFRSQRFRVSLGNGQARLRVGKRTIDVPDRSTPVGYDVRAGRAPRETSRRPTCS